MAVALDAYFTGWVVDGTSCTKSHTCSGSDRLLLVGAASYSTYADAMSYAGAAGSLTVGGTNYGNVWHKVAPASGANNVVVSFSGYGGCYLSIASWVGVNQTTPIETANITTNTANGSTSTTDSTTCPTDGVVFGSTSATYQGGSSTYTIIQGTSLGGTTAPNTMKAAGYRTSTGVVSWNRGNSGYSVWSYGIPINAAAAEASLRPPALTILDAVHRASNW